MSLSPGQRWGLGVNAYLYFFASAVLAPKSNVADEALPTDSLTLKQKGEGVIRNSTAGTGQAQVGVTLVLRLGNGPGAPVVLFHRARDHGPKTYPHCALLERGPEASGMSGCVRGCGSGWCGCIELGRRVFGENVPSKRTIIRR